MTGRRRDAVRRIGRGTHRVRQSRIIRFSMAALIMLAAPSHHPQGEVGSPPYLTIILVDGLSQRHFERELEAGNLPEIQTLIEEGALIENGIAAFPSMTGYGYYPFLTGCDATTSGVYGLRWFDRDRDRGQARNYVGRTNIWMNRDVHAWPPTLFERVRPEYCSSINTFMDRGSALHSVTDLSFSIAKFRDELWVTEILEPLPALGQALLPDWKWVEARVVQVAIKEMGLRPKIQWLTMPSPDGYFHTYGGDQNYAGILRNVDEQIGVYRAASRSLGLESDRIYAILTDHGVAEVENHVDPVAVLERKLGLAIYLEPAAWVRDDRLAAPRSVYDAQDGVLCINGNTTAYLYMKDPNEARSGSVAGSDFPDLPLCESNLKQYESASGQVVDILDALVEEPGIGLAIVRGDGDAIRIHSSDGIAEVRGATRNAYPGRGNVSEDAWPEVTSLSYSVVSGLDPLGYSDYPTVAALMDGSGYTPDEWLRATWDTEYPDAVYRLYSLLRQTDVGDVMILGAEGYDLAVDYEPVVGNFAGGHGGLARDQIRVSYVIAGPGIEKGSRVRLGRAEDVGATLHALLGLQLAGEATGRVLEPILKQPADSFEPAASGR